MTAEAAPRVGRLVADWGGYAVRYEDGTEVRLSASFREQAVHEAAARGLVVAS